MNPNKQKKMVRFFAIVMASLMIVSILAQALMIFTL